MAYETLVQKQKEYFNSGVTRSYNFRVTQLKKLQSAIRTYEKSIAEALYLDLGKSSEEAFTTEIGIVLNELTYTIKNLRKWMKPIRVKTPLMLFPAKSYKYQEPFGVVLVLSPWNYPFQLCLAPLVGALAAGNTVIAKPSSSAPHVATVIKEMLKNTFPEEYVQAVLGSAKEADALLYEKVDYIFFTGSIEVGKHVMEVASQNLTPLTLELGGKSPCIVDETGDIALIAKRVAFGKLINAGQTCIAPDFLLIKEEVKEAFITHFKLAVKSFYGDDPLTNEAYPKIINERHLTRIKGLFAGENVVFGGESSETKIAPTLVDNITFSSKIMQEEIFGPVLPILTYTSIEEVLMKFKTLHKPLALYLFSRDKKTVAKVINDASFGGATINDTIMHFVNHNVSFGGVGYSGFGAYHGVKSFTTFSHEKAVVKRGKFDLPYRYHPLTKQKAKMLRYFLK